MDTALGPNQLSFSATSATDEFVQHWAKTRIDQPQQVIARHDDAAKQLIAVSTFLQGAYLAVFTFSDLKGQVPTFVMVPMFVPLLTVVVCAATVICAVPTDLNVHRALRLLAKARGSDSYSADIDAAIKAWCEEIDRLARKKTRWLHYGNLAFIAASVVSIGLLFAAAMM